MAECWKQFIPTFSHYFLLINLHLFAQPISDVLKATQEYKPPEGLILKL